MLKDIAWPSGLTSLDIPEINGDPMFHCPSLTQLKYAIDLRKNNGFLDCCNLLPESLIRLELINSNNPHRNDVIPLAMSLRLTNLQSLTLFDLCVSASEIKALPAILETFILDLLNTDFNSRHFRALPRSLTHLDVSFHDLIKEGKERALNYAQLPPMLRVLHLHAFGQPQDAPITLKEMKYLPSSIMCLSIPTNLSSEVVQALPPQLIELKTSPGMISYSDLKYLPQLRNVDIFIKLSRRESSVGNFRCTSAD